MESEAPPMPDPGKYQAILDRQRTHFRTVMHEQGVKERLRKLRSLHSWILQNKKEIARAIFDDFRKPEMEVYVLDLYPVLSELRYAIRHLRDWAAPHRVATPLSLFGTRNYVTHEPKGSVLIMSPWNYPFMLAVGPLVSALAAGVTVILKPSEQTPHTAALLERMVETLFPPEEIKVVQGGVPESQALLQLRFDHIFFTGSPQVGRIVMQAAARYLTPVTLELGGKNPVFVDRNADMKDTVRKLAWGKFLNTGQSCVSPDHVLVEKSREAEFLQSMKERIAKMYGEDEAARMASPDYGRVVNARHFQRLKTAIEEAVDGGAEVVTGAVFDEQQNYVAPTVLRNPPADCRLMREEIFGPVMPVVSVDSLDAAIGRINAGEKPLAMYYFGRSRKNARKLIHMTSAGTTGINETTIHFQHAQLPFGGVGESGMGKGHGKSGYLEFSNARSVMQQRRGLTTVRIVTPPIRRIQRRLMDFIMKYI